MGVWGITPEIFFEMTDAYISEFNIGADSGRILGAHPFPPSLFLLLPVLSFFASPSFSPLPCPFSFLPCPVPPSLPPNPPLPSLMLLWLRYYWWNNVRVHFTHLMMICWRSANPLMCVYQLLIPRKMHQVHNPFVELLSVNDFVDRYRLSKNAVTNLPEKKLVR